ncbi:dihydroorotase family protein [Candidatus Woesearchaeota archaeon]|nr:dihydroorotase family protein [Candidatus Woesearchaeota archaeon]
MSPLILLKKGKILKESKLFLVDVLVGGGKIVKINAEINPAKQNIPIIDCQNRIILPGLIDPHVHFREPGLTYKEDFFSGSCAAAKGGFTGFFDMPNTIPPTTTIKALEEKKKLAAKSVVHYGFHFGAVSNNQEELRKALQRYDICSIKLYMGQTTGGLLVQDEDVLKEIFSMVAKAKKVLCVHAEGKDVQKAILLARNYGTTLYICHVSSKEEIAMIRHAKKHRDKKAPLYAEATPHHLFLMDNDQDRLHGFAVMKPSLKTRADQKALWHAVSDGTIDTLGTDHAPHTRGEKKSINPPFGVPGVETALPLMLDAVGKGKISLHRIQEMMVIKPAYIFGLRTKGYVKEGYDADLTVVDLQVKQQVTGKTFLSKCTWTPFEGLVLQGWPVITVVNGKLIYANGKITTTKATPFFQNRS